ncbi:hypothetical protein METSCH_C05080 [Metschnikowia aff. pulcherrima]|uniref:Uncharacterized protein n=1 Tax=Metschnikowia aff. pulcherrima TaxID=2163413 RepID=A0A4P6XME8_9ASCO|nr:hypothetical protein METSCH_C05080 [Metschnikowia aff. pulcherrima]
MVCRFVHHRHDINTSPSLSLLRCSHSDPSMRFSVILVLSLMGAFAFELDTKKLLFGMFENSLLAFNKETPAAHSRVEPSVINLFEELFYFRTDGEKWTFVMAVPENSFGGILCRLMISDLYSVYRDFGFQRAALLIQYSLLKFLTTEIPTQPSAHVLYMTKDGPELEIVTTGLLWAGLFRDGRLLYSTPISQTVKPHLLPLDFIRDLDNDGNFAFHETKQIWDCETGDLLMIAKANFIHEHFDILETVAQFSHAKKLTNLQIIEIVKIAFEDMCDPKMPFAVIQIP